MKNRIFLVLAIFVLSLADVFAQKVGFIDSDAIRENFPEAKQAEQRLQSIIEEWKRELEAIENNIQLLEDEIQKNRLIWSDEERLQKETELEMLKKQRQTYAKEKFDVDGEYDKAVKILMKGIEEKIQAATQEVAAEEGYDIVFDKSVQPLPYVNFKYDLTVKVLRKLGVDTKKLEEELQAKISKDPRNKTKESKYAPSQRRKSRNTRKQDEEIIPKKNDEQKEKETEPPIEKIEEEPGVIKK